MKFFASAIVLMLFFFQTQAQIEYKGIVNHKFSQYQKGDTIHVLGYKSYENGYSPDFIYKNEEYKKVDVSKVDLIKRNDDFWDQIWFYYRSGDVLTNGWHMDIRESIRNDSRDFITHLQQNHLFYEDEYLRDYLIQMAHRICPQKLNKNTPSYLSVYIMRSEDPVCFSFDNGVIIVSTASLAALKNEKELASLLAGEISNIVLEFNMQNQLQQIHSQKVSNFWTGLAAVTSVALAVTNYETRRSDFSFDDAIAVTAATNAVAISIMDGLSVKVSEDQRRRSKVIVSNYIAKHDSLWNTGFDDYTIRIARILTLTAWQKFYANEYKEAMDILNRIGNANMSSADDYLLKAKVYRTIYNTDESNYEALVCIKKAKEMSQNSLIDVFKEEGLLYLRLNDKIKAKQAFEDYRNGLLDIHEKVKDDNDELNWVNTLLARNEL